MTTQPPGAPRALAREATGLLLLSLGVTGALAALAAIHWTVALAAALTGLIIAGLYIRPAPKAWQRATRTAAAVLGCVGLVACAFLVSAPLGWLALSLAVAGAGLNLSTEGA